MLSTVLPNSHVTLIRQPIGGSKTPRIIQVTMAELIDRVTCSPELMEENIALATWERGDDGDRYGGRRTEVMVDYDVAVAWTPFEVLKEGQVVNVGTNVFSLVKTEVAGEAKREWAICGIADTSRLIGRDDIKVVSV